MAVQLVVTSGNRTGHIVPVSVEKFIIGRAEDCHLRSRSELISRYHCAILVGNDVVVRDLGSKNGVRLNGERVITEQKLNNGDKLGIGPLEFYVHISADGDATAELPAGNGAGTNAAWLSQTNDDGTSDTSDTVLVDRLKSLGQETDAESKQSVHNFLKKFL